jgi:hypothetical protein
LSKGRRPLAHITECGIPGIGSIPFGIHLCHFYPRRQDLVDSLVPYFAAGLRNNERCLWITAPPLPASQAEAELMRALPGLEVKIKEGQIRIIEAAEWYVSAKGMDQNEDAKRLLQEEEKALAEGYQGLRLTGNASFLTPEGWDAFMNYESAIDRAFRRRRIVALCSYGVHQCQATHVLEVIRNHHYTLDRRDVNWEVIRSPGRLLDQGLAAPPDGLRPMA